MSSSHLEPTSSRFPPWSPLLAVIFVIVTYVVSQFVGQLIVLIYPLLQGWSMERTADWLVDSTYAQFMFILVVEALTVLLLYLFMRSYKVTFWQLGLVRPKLRDGGMALLAIPVYIVGYIVLLSLATTLFPAIDVEQKQEIGFDTVRTGLELALTFISLAILPPLVEEITMRGFLFTSLVGRYKFWVAAIVTSIIFGAAHLQFGSGQPLLWVAAIDTFVLSLVLCYMKYKTGSLWPGIFLHGIKNATAFTVLFLVPLINA